MKRLTALILVIALTASLVAAFGEVADVSGVWQLMSIQAEGRTFTAASLGLVMTVTLNPDGTAAFYEKSSDGTEEDSGTWLISGNAVHITLSGDAMNYTLTNGSLVFKAGGDTLTFTRDAVPEPKQVKEVSASGKTPFIGSWTIESLLIEGVTLDAASEGVTMTLKVSDADISFSYAEKDSANKNKETFAYTLDGGRLKDETGIFQLALCDDGTVRLITTVTEENQQHVITYCFKRAE